MAPLRATDKAVGWSARRPLAGAPESPVSPASPERRLLARRRRACGCRGCLPLPGRGAAPHTQSANLPISQFPSWPLCQPRSIRPHRRRRRQPGLQPPRLLQASKPLNFQASLERPAGGSRPQNLLKICEICGSPPLAVFVHLRGPSCSSCQPRRANPPQFACSHTRRALAARSPFSVFRSRGRFGASRLHALFSGARSAPFWTLKGFGSDHYRVSTPTTIVVDLGPL